MSDQASTGGAIGAIAGMTICFFLNATFIDFHVERNVLQHHDHPELRWPCATSGFRHK
jgi:hypothetical protein